ncbi:RDS3 complex subunit 10 [[Candida] jaroonii]|uniref:RDS3 complex subunit 10 n=1 Tax=[Candida] jaroonii TaxID=467808 RepID=A0ACA9Y8C1_9ASCO|nr:RDS3 complex subunit 10 [[Candida] jaroonii]
MSDKVKEINQFNLYRSKYGITDENTTRDEFINMINKESYSSIIQHKSLLYYNSIAKGELMEIERLNMLKKLAKECEKK